MCPSVIEKQIVSKLVQFRNEVNEELKSILSWWSENMIDHQKGGFYGSINNNNVPDLSAPKGVVLNSRILWSFSAMYSFTKDIRYLNIAKRAFVYIKSHFLDKEYGGVFWSVNEEGRMKDGRKQIYGIAFCIYGMSEYYKVTKENAALQIAIELFSCIEKYSFDKHKSGYIEAFDRKWNNMEDIRLSEKDDNEKKTMNTHLHIVEAYASLYTIWPDETLKNKIISLLKNFDDYFINRENFHLHLFMDENWNSRSALISFGHDIEAAWLLLDCAEITRDENLIKFFRKTAIDLADAVLEGLDKDGGLWYEYDPQTDHRIKEKHSWPQAEAMVGFFNAFQLTGDEKYFQHSQNSFNFIKKKIKDHVNGEWYWGIYENGSVINREKAGFWKCPYHSTRACIEIEKRIREIERNAIEKNERTVNQ